MPMNFNSLLCKHIEKHVDSNKLHFVAVYSRPQGVLANRCQSWYVKSKNPENKVDRSGLWNIVIRGF